MTDSGCGEGCADVAGSDMERKEGGILGACINGGLSSGDSPGEPASPSTIATSGSIAKDVVLVR
jgi:hypothetical protein